jgi:hypothetical protein
MNTLLQYFLQSIHQPKLLMAAESLLGFQFITSLLNGENTMNMITCNDKDLPDDLQAIANEAARITIDAIERAAAHMLDPAKFPIPANGALEVTSLAVLKQRQLAKPRQMRAFQLRSVSSLSRVPAPATPAPSSLVTLLRAQPTLVGRGILAELKAMKPAVKALKLETATAAAIKDAAATKNTEKFLDTLGFAFSIVSGAMAASASAPAAAPATGFTKLILNLDRMKCHDDVGVELTDFFEDDIRLGGLGVDSTGQQKNVPGFKVGDFNKGETIRFKPKRKFVEFDLTRAGTWPRAFSTTFLLAESDGSGAFLDALRALWEAVGEVVEELVVTAVIAGAGAIGIAVGAPGGPVGMVIGAVVGAAVGLVLHYLFDSLEDDVFEPVTVTLLMPDERTLFTGGQRRSGMRSENLTHPSASYTLKYEWELVA